MWEIRARVDHDTGDGWRTIKGVPTFYLNESVQGIVNEAHAIRVAREVVDSFRLAGKVHISAVRV